MRKILFVIQFFVFLFSCSGGHNKENCHKAGVLSVLKKNIDKENCFVEDHAKFVSLFFAKTPQRTIVQVATFIDRPTRDNTKCYYKQDSSYIYLCSGYCEEFRLKNHFMEWNDSLNRCYQRYDENWSSSDSLYEFYMEHFKNLKERFYEYEGNTLVYIDSISKEEIDSVDSQAMKFDIGYLFKREAPILELDSVAPPPAIREYE